MGNVVVAKSGGTRDKHWASIVTPGVISGTGLQQRARVIIQAGLVTSGDRRWPTVGQRGSLWCTGLHPAGARARSAIAKGGGECGGRVMALDT